MDLLTFTFESGGRPLYEQLYRRIAGEIAGGRLRAGERLPSKRKLGEHLRVSVNTVDGAYRMLVDEGYVEARPRSGFFAAALPAPLAAPPPRPAPDAKPAEGAACRYDLRTGLVDPDTFQADLWLQLARKVLSRMGAHLAAGDPQGERVLREGLTRHLREFRALDAAPEQMVVGAGMEYLLGLLAGITGEGAVYALEDPGYPKLRAVLANGGVPMRFVGLDDAGMRPDRLRASGADVAYVTPTHQYPMGVTMPVGRRLELIAWAEERRGRYIVEDDYDSEFRYAGRPVPSMTGLTRSERVVYIGTMSRALAPSTRFAYMVLPPALLAVFRERFGTYACTVSMFEQLLLAEFIGTGMLVRHLNRARALYRRRRACHATRSSSATLRFVTRTSPRPCGGWPRRGGSTFRGPVGSCMGGGACGIISGINNPTSPESPTAAMKCEICKVNQASRSIKRNVDGAARELFVCDSCARTSPHAGSGPMSLTDVLFSLGMQMGAGQDVEDNVCPACGTSRNQVRERHRLGCPRCYDVFETDIRTFISGQPTPTTRRDTPVAAPGEEGDLEKLKRQLAKAIEEERYEDAARLVEDVRRLGGAQGTEGDHGR